MVLSKKKAISRISASGRITETQAKVCGFYVEEGVQLDAQDDVLSTWYIGRAGHTLNKGGAGHATKSAAMSVIRKLILCITANHKTSRVAS